MLFAICGFIAICIFAIFGPGNTSSNQTNQNQPAYIPSVQNVASNDNQNSSSEELRKQQYSAAKAKYEQSVSNINSIWNSLFPATQNTLRAEQKSINKQREQNCHYQSQQHYGTFYEKETTFCYQCEIPLINQRTEELRKYVGVTLTPPLPLPNTGDTNNPNLQGQIPLMIKTSSGSNYYVKIEDAYNHTEPASYFIRGGDTLDVRLPSGSYIIKYASGNTWYGGQALFGDETQYAKADQIFNFSFDGYNYSGYTIELIRQVNGNLHTSSIDSTQF